MAIAQGISKITVIKKQTALGSVAAGSGGQTLRRESSTNTLKKDTYGNSEIVTHQQSTGKTHGLRSVDTQLSGVLSPSTYMAYLGSILRKDPVATTAQTGKSITIGAATLGVYPLTVTSGTLLTAGFKIGDVIRLTVGALNAANINKNLLITAIASETACSVRPVNGVALVAEGPVTTTTITVIGKKVIAPLTGHTKDYYTVEDWHGDITQSEVFSDVILGSADISLPATGNATISLSGAGRNRETLTASQVLTTPTAETTTNVLAAVNGLLLVNGAVIANITGLSIKIDGKVAGMGAVVGSNYAPDIQRGIIEVTGQFTAFYQDAVLPGLFDAATQVQLIGIITDNATASSDFISFNLPAITLDGDGKDDGDKAIVRTYPYTARLFATGGAALANDKTIISIQDSAA